MRVPRPSTTSLASRPTECSTGVVCPKGPSSSIRRGVGSSDSSSGWGRSRAAAGMGGPGRGSGAGATADLQPDAYDHSSRQASAGHGAAGSLPRQPPRNMRRERHPKCIGLSLAVEPGLHPASPIIFRHEAHLDRTFPSQVPSFTDIRQAVGDKTWKKARIKSQILCTCLRLIKTTKNGSSPDKRHRNLFVAPRF